MIEIKTSKEKVVLAGLLTSGIDPSLFEEDMQEMRMLCETAGALVISTIIQRRESPAASTFLGLGKLDEIKKNMKDSAAKTLVVDAQLSPGQIRNIEKIVDGKVIDRGQLILDIFAKHARTNEARIQVELAQMKMLYPRLTHAWTHFSQQVGGIGTVGPGEKQLEVDRRLVKNKIADLNEKLRKIEKNRVTQKKGRNNIFQAVLVGYTNVGKSSLLNSLSGSDVFVENKLFATLDTSTRRTFIPGAGNIVISDTVGFLRKLPHQLVASFRSTLSVVSDADLLIIVVDGSSEWVQQQLKTVHDVLAELNAQEIPSLLVFNKMDLVSDLFIKKQFMLEYPEGVFISAFNKDDIVSLKNIIAQNIKNFEKDRQISDIIIQKTKNLVHTADQQQ